MDTLLSMGFDASAAKIALQRSGGNVDVALDLLLTGGEEQDFATSVSTNDTSSGGLLIQLPISQYSFAEAGSSACTVIAASMVDYVLPALQTGVNPRTFSSEQLSDVVIQGVMKYSQLPNRTIQHLSVDELQAEFFTNVSVLAGGLLQGVLDEQQAFSRLFQQAQSISDPNKPVGLVLTKPPETICIILPPVNNPNGHYMLFDSHSRPQDGLEGSYLFVANDRSSLLAKLNHIFPSAPANIFDGGFMSSMYNMFEATVFQS